MRDCWPDWLRRRSNQLYGPGIEDAIPYPVYQVQPPAISSDNPNVTSAGYTPSFFQSYSNTVAAANLDTTIFQINPNNVYDTIACVAYDLGGVESIPVFLSFDRPGRLSGTPPTPATGNADGAEAIIWTGCAVTAVTLAGFDKSSMPTWIQQAVVPKTSRAPYTSLYFETPCTNRPFYLWFRTNSTFDGTPNPGIAFKTTWFVRGR